MMWSVWAAVLVACHPRSAHVSAAAKPSWHVEKAVVSTTNAPPFSGLPTQLVIDGELLALVGRSALTVFNVTDVREPAMVSTKLLKTVDVLKGLKIEWPMFSSVRAAEGHWYGLVYSARMASTSALVVLNGTLEGVAALDLGPFARAHNMAGNFTIRDMYVAGRYLYFFRQRLVAVDVGNPAAPAVASASEVLYDATAQGVGFAHAGRHLFIVTQTEAGVSSLSVWDLHASPQQPSLVSSRKIGGRWSGAAAVAVRGDYLYVAAAGGPFVFDVSDPKAVATVWRPLMTQAPQEMGSGAAIVLAGDRLYVWMILTVPKHPSLQSMHVGVFAVSAGREYVLDMISMASVTPFPYAMANERGYFFESVMGDTSPQLVVSQRTDYHGPPRTAAPLPPAPTLTAAPTATPAPPPPETTPAPAATGCGGACVQWLSAAAASLLILASLVLLWHVGRRAVLRRKRRPNPSASSDSSGNMSSREPATASADWQFGHTSADMNTLDWKAPALTDALLGPSRA
eukprot:TRINITY_DN7708_c0_g2_i1.p1 TRINITY_DN7708_c0_g2~~TRINITY_DN7708_c0_g2_i1.p1  ORF type:complete len:513 (+),score=130.13 TRINITY_DN7708_c0_g2_i1:93-1631(+)